MRTFSDEFYEDLEGYGILCGYAVALVDPETFMHIISDGYSVEESDSYVLDGTYKEFTISLKTKFKDKDVKLFFDSLDSAVQILQGEFWLTNLSDTCYAFYQQTEECSWHVRSIPEVPEFLLSPVLL